ncbi:MAG: fumarylacetoacetate hydrolase family protein [Nocardioidaceae bacterium]|nr:fumarylacetoacetate hydrolase family protein [Nocardioidaceae bacterium]
MTEASTATDAVDRAATRLIDAAATATPCAPVRDLIGDTDVDAAYAVQQQVVADRLASGANVVGRKIGLTSPAVQAQLGVDQPDFGVLLNDMDVSADAGAVPTGRLLQPKVEAEVAFVLARDLVDGDLGPEQVRAAVDYAVPALEIVDSRVAGWDITFGDTVADNASGGLYVLGTERRTLDDFAPVEVQMEMTVNDQNVSSGNGAACLGDPLNALAWLAATARDHGQPLLAGQVVLSGALGPMAPVVAGDTVTATITGLGTVSATFATTDDTTGAHT